MNAAENGFLEVVQALVEDKKMESMGNSFKGFINAVSRVSGLILMRSVTVSH